MKKPAPPLAFGPIAILHAVADGNRFGFDIMDATGLTSGTVYPALDKLESLGYLSSHWENVRAARRDKRPPRRYFDLTARSIPPASRCAPPAHGVTPSSCDFTSGASR